MTWQTMYPANPGSPYTTLASGIDDDDTSISLTADPGFAAATNLACIWDDAGNFEVVRYTDLTGTTLAVERAFEGTAQAWSAGAYIANLIPAYAINSLQNNIDELDEIKASSTPAALSILVYDGTPSAGDLTTYDEIYTTPALCFAALPEIINHAVTITIREADGSAYAAATLQRVVAGGSITIQGEYYWNNTIVSAGSGAGKFNVNAADTGIQAGDKVYLMQYSGTVGSSSPSDAFIDTVSGVDGTEVSLTTRTTDAFDSTWHYVIVRTEMSKLSILNTSNVKIKGIHLSNAQLKAAAYFQFVSCIFYATSGNGMEIQDSFCDDYTRSIYVGFNGNSTSSRIRSKNSRIEFSNIFIQQTTGTCINLEYGSRGATLMTYILGESGSTGVNVSDNSFLLCHTSRIDGISSESKMTTGEAASLGGKIKNQSVTFGYNITTQKSPANWAATTDGSYIS